MNDNRIQGVIWDLDGTLLESGKTHFETEKSVFAEYGIDIDKETYERFLSTRIEDFVNTILIEQCNDTDPQIILNEIAERTKKNYLNGIALTAHAASVLSSVYDHYKQALATAREQEVALLAINKNDLAQFFDQMVFAEDVVEGKPDPEVFLIVSKSIGMDPEHTMVIEDGLNGIKAANDANMISVARRANHNQDVDFSSADHVIDDLRQVLDILKEY